MRKIIKKILYFFFKTKNNLLKTIFNLKSGVYLKDNIIIKGKPLIEVHKDAMIEVNNNVTLNSRNSGYHVNMHSPVKLMADEKNA